MSTLHPGASDEDWPLAPSDAQSAVQLLGAICIAQPYGILEDEEFRAELAKQIDENAGDPAVPVAEALLAGDRWTALGGLNRLAAEWSQEDRDFAGIPLVLDDGFVADEAIEADPAVYWRSVDTALEAISCSYSADELLTAAGNIMNTLLEESKSGAIVTSSALIDFISGFHQGQAVFTGLYIPGADTAARWGQRKLDELGDDALAFALAAETLQLQMLAAGGETERVRRYGTLLTEDVHDLSVKRTSGNPDARAKQVAMFSYVLRLVADLLGDDPDGLATAAAPALEGMRLTEARHLAQTQFVNLVEVDGRMDDQTPARSVWADGNWRVTRQAPAPGQSLGAARRVTVWILKDGEHLSSAAHRDADRQKSG